MFSGKGDTDNDKRMQKNKQLQANKESVVQDGEHLESTKGDEKSIQFTLNGAEMNAKQSETDLEKNDVMVKKWSTLQSRTTPNPLLEDEEEEEEKETNECVSANQVPDDEETNKPETNTHTTEGCKLSFDRKVSTLADSQIESFEKTFVETYDGKSIEKIGFLERSHQDRDRGNSVQRITKQKAPFSTSKDGPFKALLSSETSNITSVKTDKKVSNDKAEKCDFCKGNAMLICESCSVFCCEDCMENEHPHKGPYLKHKIRPIHLPGWSEHYARCSDHGLFAQLFCSYCERSRCTECVKTRCKLHFKGRISDADMDNEKLLLLEELEKAAARLRFLGRYKEDVQQEISNIQMTGLLRREQIRQEFVSFHDLLIQKEGNMLEQLDQEVNERVSHVINTLQASVESLEKEDVNLTTTVTELVQTPDDTKFIEEYVRAKDLCQQMDVRVKEFYRDWARDSTYTPSPVLDNYFTMQQEKRDLFEKLNGAMELPKLHFKQNTLFTYPNIPIRLSEYMESSEVPPSTDVSYTMQLFHKRILVYELTSRHLQDMGLNGLSTYLLVPGSTFLLKVTSEFMRHDFQDKTIRRGNPCHMLISVQNVRVYPSKTINFSQSRSNKFGAAVNKNAGATLSDPKGIQTTATVCVKSQKESVTRSDRITLKAYRKKNA